MGELGVTVPLGDIVSLSGLTGYADREFLGTLGADIRSSSLTLSLLQTPGSQGIRRAIWSPPTTRSRCNTPVSATVSASVPSSAPCRARWSLTTCCSPA
ncbi:hypothetical protein O0544_14255 [Edwardsiella anguillarum]|nr:hypothetical protein [Edwardsiella anguillarum]